MLTIRDSVKMDFVASVLSGLVIEMNSGTVFDILSNRAGLCGHYKAWLGLSYSDQWRWPALLGMYYRDRFHSRIQRADRGLYLLSC